MWTAWDSRSAYKEEKLSFTVSIGGRSARAGVRECVRVEVPGLMKHALPALFQAFDGARAAINTGSETEMFSALYVRLVSTDFSERVLAPRPANLAVLKVTGVAWSDLGEPGRVMTVLARVGIEPEWARPAVRA